MFVVGHTHASQTQVRKPSVGILSEIGMGDKPAISNARVEGNVKIVDTIPSIGDSEVMCVRFSPDGNVLAVGHATGKIAIYNAQSHQCLYVLSDNEHLPVTSIRFRVTDIGDKPEHKNIVTATYASGKIKFWHYSSGKCLHCIDEVRQTLSSAYNPNGSHIATCGADSQIHIYDVETKRKIRSMEPSDSRDVMNGHRARVFTIQYHPHRPTTFLTGGWDDTVQFWDERQKHAIRRIYGPHICGDSLDIDPVHNHILTGSWRKDSVLQIWDFETGDRIKEVPQDSMHRSLLYSAQWLGKENIICGGCEHNMARIIDRGTLNTVGQLVDLPAGVFCIDNDRQARPKIAAGASNKIYILRMEKQQ